MVEENFDQKQKEITTENMDKTATALLDIEEIKDITIENEITSPKPGVSFHPEDSQGTFNEHSVSPIPTPQDPTPSNRNQKKNETD